MGKLGYSKETIHERAKKEQVAHAHVPGLAYTIENPTDKLIHMVGGGFFNEPKYYDENRTYAEFYSELMTTGRISSKCVDATGLNAQAKEVIETAHAIANGPNPEDLLIIASWCRDPEHGLKLRTTPQILLAVAGANSPSKKFILRYGKQIIKRADEICDVFAAYRHMFQPTRKGTLPHQLRLTLAEAFSRMSAYALIKYNGSNHPNFTDVLRMVGGDKKLKKFAKNPENGFPINKGLFKYLSEGVVTEDSPDIVKYRDKIFKSKDIGEFNENIFKNAGLTWENLISHFGSNRETWEAAIPLMGEMALLRNLRNFEQNNISKKSWDRVYETLEKVEQTKQLPFRFFAASKEVSTTEAKSVCSMMLDRAVGTLADLRGNTVVLVDNSGSVQGCSISGNSKLIVADAGNMLGAVIAKRFGRRAKLGIFGDSLIWINFDAYGSTLSIKENIENEARTGQRQFAIPRYKNGRGVGGGTETGLWWALKNLRDEKYHADRIILLSDLCCYTQGDTNCGFDMKPFFGKDASIESLVRLYRKEVNPDCQVYSINLSGYGQSQLNTKDKNTHLMSGWSESIIDLISQKEGLASQLGETAAVPTIDVLRQRYGILTQ